MDYISSNFQTFSMITCTPFAAHCIEKLDQCVFSQAQVVAGSRAAFDRPHDDLCSIQHGRLAGRNRSEQDRRYSPLARVSVPVSPVCHARHCCGRLGTDHPQERERGVRFNVQYNRSDARVGTPLPVVYSFSNRLTRSSVPADSCLLRGVFGTNICARAYTFTCTYMRAYILRQCTHTHTHTHTYTHTHTHNRSNVPTRTHEETTCVHIPPFTPTQ